MNILESLMKANGIASLKKKPDAERIAELEAENAELKTRLDEQDDALIDLANWIEEVQNG